MIRIKNPIAPRLPSEYQEVEYIESTGTQYIDSGLKATPTTMIEADFQFTSIANAMRLFGITLSASYSGRLSYDFYINSASDFAYTYNNNQGNWISTNIKADTNRHNLVFNANQTLILDNNKISMSGTVNFNSFWNIFIFASFQYGGANSAYNYSKVKIYEFKIYENDALVRNFVPVIRNSDNVAGLYDLVNNVFYTNAGTGEFLVGNKVNKRDANIKPMLEDKPLIRRYAGDKLVYGKKPIEDEQLVNYTMLYDNGDECIDITGGWLGANYYTNSIVTKYDKYIHLHSYRAMMYTKNKIDLSAYVGFGMFNNHLYFTNVSKTELYIQYSSTSDIRYGMFKEFDTNGWRQHILFWDRVSNTNNIYVPYSNLSNYYLGVYVGDGTCNAYMNVRNIALFRSDDWQRLANIAGITASSIDDILNNSTILLANKEAVDFMIYQCTGSFMASAVTNETFLTALNNSAYNTKIQANEHWNKFLSMVA